MKHVALLLVVISFLSSCKKEEQEADNSLPAASFLNVAYGSDAAQKMDVYLPAGRKQQETKTFVLIHGGAWVEGDKSEFTSYLPTIKQRLPDYAIAVINYRLASTSGNYFPAQENDLKAALNFLVQNSSNYQISSDFVLLGTSAGAHMALLQGYKYATPSVRAIIDFFGPADMVQLYNQAPTTIAQLGMQMLLSGTPQTNPAMYYQSSPINFIDAQDPPTIIFHGTNDLVVNVSQSTQLQLKLQMMGVTNSLHTYNGVGHEVWPSPIMNDAFDKMEAFIKTHVP